MKACFRIFRHELAKLLADRKLLASMFLTPVLMVALVSVMLSILPEEKSSASRVYVLHQLPLEEQEGLDIVPVPCDTLEQLQEQGVLAPADVVLDIGNNGAVIYYQNTNNESYQTSIVCRQLLYDRQIANFAEERHIALPETPSVTDLNDSMDMANALAASLLPYLLVISLFQSTRSFAVDAIAGEKERGVFDRYFLAPVSPMSVVNGKLLCSALCGMVSSIVYFLAVIGYSAVTGQDAFGLSGANITGSMVGVLFLFAVILSCFTAAIAVVCSLCAKTEKEAQSMLLPVLVIFTVAAFAAMLRTGSASTSAYLIPVYNLCILMQDVLYGAVRYPYLLLTEGSMIICFLFLYMAMARLFKRNHA